MHVSFIRIFIFTLLLSSSLFSRNIDLDAIAKESAKEQKHIFIFLHKTGCPYCENMQEFTLDDSTINEFIRKNFLFVHINVSEDDSITYKEQTGSGKNFAKFIGYNFYPSSLFLNKNLELVYAIPGYQNEKNFYYMLNYVQSRSYQTQEYREYYNTHKFNIEE